MCRFVPPSSPPPTTDNTIDGSYVNIKLMRVFCECAQSFTTCNMVITSNTSETTTVPASQALCAWLTSHLSSVQPTFSCSFEKHTHTDTPTRRELHDAMAIAQHQHAGIISHRIISRIARRILMCVERIMQYIYCVCCSFSAHPQNDLRVSV